MDYLIEIFEDVFENNILENLAVKAEIAVTSIKFNNVKNFNKTDSITSMKEYNFENFLNRLKNKLIKIKDNKIEKRKYGKLLVSGTIFDEHKDDIHIRKNTFGEVIKVEYENINKAHRQYIIFKNNPKVSYDYFKGEIKNINIESRSVRNFFQINRKNKKIMIKEKFKKMNSDCIILLISSLALGVAYVFIQKISKIRFFGMIIAFVVTIFVTLVYKEGIKDIPSKINRSLKKIVEKILD